MAPSGRAGRTPERRRPAARPDRRRRPPPVEPGGTGAVGRRGGGDAQLISSPCNGEVDRRRSRRDGGAAWFQRRKPLPHFVVPLPTSWGGERPQPITE